MDPNEIKALFDTLDGSQQPQGYVSDALAGDKILIAKAPSGLPALMVQHDGNAPGSLDRMSLRNLFLRSNRMSIGDDGQTEYFALVELTTNEDELIDWFFEVLAPVCDRLELLRTATEIESELTSLVELLAPSPRSLNRELVGLWGELLVISIASDLDLVVDAWHNDLNNKWDFSHKSSQVEVKATTGDRRIHDFALEQFQEPDGLLLASLLLRKTESGTSLDQLIERLIDETHGSSRAKIQEITSIIVAGQEKDARELRFDSAEAENNLAFFRAADIPRIEYPPPLGVSGVRYRSDLQQAQSYEPDTNDPKLWRAVAD